MTWNMRTKAKAAADAKIKSYAQGGPVPDYEGEAQGAGDRVTEAARPRVWPGEQPAGDYKSESSGPRPNNLRNKDYMDKLYGPEKAERIRKDRGSY